MTVPSTGALALALAAESYLEEGLCALPAIRNGDVKRPAVGSWKAYQNHRPTFDEIRQSFDEPNPTNSMCVVCGAVSRNLEMIDFDLAGEAFEPWKKLVEAKAPGLFDRLVIETSPSGGFHVVYRCEGVVSCNMKLAQRRIECDDDEQLVVAAKSYMPRQDADGKWHILVTMIETRGEGGLFLCAPSPGYEIIQGDLRHPPVLTTDERTALLECAWALDENKEEFPDGLNVVAGIIPSVSTIAHSDPLKPGDDFNRRGDVREILIAAGWKPSRTTADEIEPMVRHLVERHGVRKVRLTGGDPTARSDLLEIVQRIASIDGIDDHAMTTNGLSLASRARDYANAGLSRVNVSLDSLDPAQFASMTGVDGLDRVLRGIDTAIEAGLTPLKINTVVIRGENEAQLPELVRYAAQRDIAIRFIELMPMGPMGAQWADPHVPADEMCETLDEIVTSWRPLSQGSDSAKAFRVQLNDGPEATIGFITPMSCNFCSACNRIRIASDGSLYPCLMDKPAASIMPAVRPHFDPDAFDNLLYQGLAHKAHEHPAHGYVTMTNIGG